MILMRHGESAFNVHFARTRSDPGIRDAPLTEAGHAQARAAALRLAAHGVRRVLCSPYTRALQTASVVASALDLPVTVNRLAGEHAWFTCDLGTPRTDLETAWPHLDLSAIDEVWWPEPVEPHDRFALRCAELRTVLAATGDGDGLLVVCHWGVIRGLTGLEVDNCALVAFDPALDGRPAVLLE